MSPSMPAARKLSAEEVEARWGDSEHATSGAARIAGCLAAVLGFSVVLGWHFDSVLLVQVLPSYVPMQFNTALGFILLGAGVFAAGLGRRTIAVGAGGLAGLLGLLTLAQYMVGVDLKIDELLMQHTIQVETSHPGRMAPNSALCLSLAGIALVGWGLAGSRVGSMLLGALGTLVLALAGTAMVGYLTGLTSAYGWGSFTRMGVHTAVGYLFVGAGLLMGGWRRAPGSHATLPSWYPVPAGMGILAVILLLWQAIVSHRDAMISAEVERKGRLVASAIREHLEINIRALERMAARWERRGGLPREEWEADALQYLSDLKGMVAVEWADSDDIVRWIVPTDSVEASVGRNLRDDPVLMEALFAARLTGRAAVSRSVVMEQGHQGFQIFMPLKTGTGSGGSLVTLLRWDTFFSHQMSALVREGFSSEVFEGEELLHAEVAEGEAGDHPHLKETELKLRNRTWLIRTWPREATLAAASSGAPGSLLGVGLILAVLFPVTLHFWQASRMRELRNEQVSRELRQEAAVREQAEKELRELNVTLESRIFQATGDLEQRAEELARTNQELETFNRLAVGREERMILLKSEINRLSRELGKHEPYDLSGMSGVTRGGHADG